MKLLISTLILLSTILVLGYEFLQLGRPTPFFVLTLYRHTDFET